jgi:hypothetical protein
MLARGSDRSFRQRRAPMQHVGGRQLAQVVLFPRPPLDRRRSSERARIA